MNPKNYSITIRQGIFDGEECFEARVKELPDLVEYADTHEEAYEMALDAIETTAEEFAEKGRSMPAPLEEEPPKPEPVSEKCPRNRTDCNVLGLAFSEEDGSFTCCGRNREPNGDVYRLCFHNSHIDHIDDCDQNDLLSQLYVISRALLVVEQEIERIRAE